MMSNARHKGLAPRAAAIGLVLAAFALGGCASTLEDLPEKYGGLPKDVPAKPAVPMAFPNVYEVRPTRTITPLDEAEQKKLETELLALRESQKQRATAPDAPPPPPPPPPAPPKKADAKKPPAAKKPSDPPKAAEAR
jgi:outer membrane biosynthesis protein TonB